MRHLIKLLVLCTFMLCTAVAKDNNLNISNDLIKKENGVFLGPNGLAPLLEVYTQKQLEDGVNVGTEFCIACHQDYSEFRETKHIASIREALPEYAMMPGKGIVMDYDSNGVDDFSQGLDFNTISSAFDTFKPNAPILSLVDGKYYVQIGELTMPVIATYGGTGDWKQRLMLRIPVTGTESGLSNENYISPIQYNEKVHQYSLYHPEAWYDENNAPRYELNEPVAQMASENARSFSKKCMGCHTNGIRSLAQNADGEWIGKASPATLPNGPFYPDMDHDGISDLVNTDCESCHGPGSAHIMAGGNPSMIVNPSKIDSQLATDICGRCHNRVKSVPNGLHDWPRNDETGEKFLPGMSLDGFWTDATGDWPDGVNSKSHHQQYADLLVTNKVAYGYACYSCHNVHKNTKHLVREEIVKTDHDTGEQFPITTNNDDNTLCLACHATHGPFETITRPMMVDFDANKDEIAKVVSAHTKHPYAPERSMGLSRCSKCHMPKTVKSAVAYDIHSHTFEAMSPEKTLELGMPNSCAASCHSQKAILFKNGFDPSISTWNDVFDEKEAEALKAYYGPGGQWWDNTAEGEGH